MGGVHPQAHSRASPLLWTQRLLAASPKGGGAGTSGGGRFMKGVGLKLTLGWGGSVSEVLVFFLKQGSGLQGEREGMPHKDGQLDPEEGVCEGWRKLEE